MPAAARTLTLVLAGQEWQVELTEEALAGVHRPILSLLKQKARAKGGRFIVFIAGPPAAGKTTLAAIWELLAREDPEMPPVQALPMDGFHFPNAYLARTRIRTERGEVDLRRVKGSPETYDVSAFADRLRAVRQGGKVNWPYYDRRIHDPVDGAIAVHERGILLVEGNFLLLDEEPWRNLTALADLSIFIESAVQTLGDALPRLRRGGKSPEAALEHHRLVDHANYRKVMDRRVAADLTLLMNKDREITIDKGGAAGSS